jgi:hypothetical protein
MEELLRNWKPIKKTDYELLFEDANTLHHAAQFLTFAAQSYLPAKADDSHTACYWITGTHMVKGREIPTASEAIRIGLRYPGVELVILDSTSDVIAGKSFLGNTKEEMLNWFKSKLKEYGLNTTQFNSVLSYKLPPNKTDNGAPFEIEKPENLEELSNYRSNGHMLLTHFAERFSTSDEVLVWPHHFDEGVHVPMVFKGNEVTHSLSFGLAVPDTYYNSPYFFVTAWRKNGLEYEALPNLKGPGKWHSEGWTGQVLEGRELTGLRSEAQAETAIHFLEEAISNATELLVA